MGGERWNRHCDPQRDREHPRAREYLRGERGKTSLGRRPMSQTCTRPAVSQTVAGPEALEDFAIFSFSLLQGIIVTGTDKIAWRFQNWWHARVPERHLAHARGEVSGGA